MMKNKLYKYNHKAPYYVARNLFLFLGLFIGLASAVMVPTTINLLSKEPLKLNAEAETVNKLEEDISEDNEEELQEYSTSIA